MAKLNRNRNRIMSKEIKKIGTGLAWCCKHKCSQWIAEDCFSLHSKEAREKWVLVIFESSRTTAISGIRMLKGWKDRVLEWLRWCNLKDVSV